MYCFIATRVLLIVMTFLFYFLYIFIIINLFMTVVLLLYGMAIECLHELIVKSGIMWIKMGYIDRHVWCRQKCVHGRHESERASNSYKCPILYDCMSSVVGVVLCTHYYLAVYWLLSNCIALLHPCIVYYTIYIFMTLQTKTNLRAAILLVVFLVAKRVTHVPICNTKNITKRTIINIHVNCSKAWISTLIKI